jgi:dihydroflavonol-4-reductase
VKIAVTGASGFIGAVLVPLLQDAGHELRLLTRDRLPKTNTPDTDIFAQNTGWIKGDMLDKESLQHLVNDTDAVIHLAAMISMKDSPDETLIKVNVTGTKNLAEAAKQAGVKRFIHVSSAAAYEQAPYDQPLAENKNLVQSKKYSYPYSKAAAQRLALEYNNNNNDDATGTQSTPADKPADKPPGKPAGKTADKPTGMAVLVLAPTAVLGPYDHEPSLLGAGILKLYRGSIPVVFPGGVDMVDVRDVAGAIANALFHGTPGSTYLLSGHYATLSQVNQLVRDVKGKTKPLPVLPFWPILAVLPVMHAWSRIRGASALYTRQSVDNLLFSNRKIDHAKARRELGFHPRALAETIRDTIAWFKKRGDIQ